MSMASIYVIACHDREADEALFHVSYWVDDESLAASLCRLRAQELTGAAGDPPFCYKPAASFQPGDQVLMDEPLQWLRL
ncbi:MAG: hypothetical protein ACP5XB_05175 [Isosphaeraceae bacterium]